MALDSKVTYCKICRKTYRKTHTCLGEPYLIKCNGCSREMLQSSLSKHLKYDCPAVFPPKPAFVECPCGKIFKKGHWNGKNHLKSSHHLEWEMNDAKERKLGVSFDGKVIIPASITGINPPWKYYAGVSVDCTPATLKELDENNEKAGEGLFVVQCFCGFKIHQSHYDKHCKSEFHVKWIKNYREYYSKRAQENSDLLPENEKIAEEVKIFSKRAESEPKLMEISDDETPSSPLKKPKTIPDPDSETSVLTKCASKLGTNPFYFEGRINGCKQLKDFIDR